MCDEQVNGVCMAKLTFLTLCGGEEKISWCGVVLCLVFRIYGCLYFCLII